MENGKEFLNNRAGVEGMAKFMTELVKLASLKPPSLEDSLRHINLVLRKVAR
jgi:hypothetical protein